MATDLYLLHLGRTQEYILYLLSFLSCVLSFCVVFLWRIRIRQQERGDDLIRTQTRFPDEIHEAIRHVGAAEGMSFNAALVRLVSQALEFRHEQLPTKLLSQLKDRPRTD